MIRKAKGRPTNKLWKTGNRKQAASMLQRMVRRRQAGQQRLFRPLRFRPHNRINSLVNSGNIGRFGRRPNGMPFMPSYAQVARNRQHTNIINGQNRNPRANQISGMQVTRNRQWLPATALRHYPQQVNALNQPIRRHIAGSGRLDPRYRAPQYPTAVMRGIGARIRGSDELR